MKIVVLAGGTSTERDVSLSSGKKIYQALRQKGHKVILLDVYLGVHGDSNGIFDKDRTWDDNIDNIKEQAPDIEGIKAKREKVNSGYFGENVIEICKQADMVFLALHGENGENGKIQATFDLLGISYTGSDYIGAALAMDKGLTKELFANHQIRTPNYIKMNRNLCNDNFSFPKVVKVANGGSSIGVYIAHNNDEYQTALREAFTIEHEVIVEEYIAGREFSVGILNGKALPVIEIVPKTGFYDYKNKYQEGSAVEICPAEIPIEKSLEMQRIAEKVFEVLQLGIYARIDFIMSDTDGELYCLEGNTLPGMTPTSLLPQEAAVIGIDYPSLCEKIIILSQDRNIKK